MKRPAAESMMLSTCSIDRRLLGALWLWALIWAPHGHAQSASAPADTPTEISPQTSEDADAPEAYRTLIRPTKSVDHWVPPTAVIDRGQMQDALADLPEVLEAQPGLRIRRMGGLGAFSTLSIRGSTGDQVNVFIDGIPLNGAVGGPVDFSTIPLGPVDSVAIYRGHSPMTFGESAIGGAVNIRTRHIHYPSFELELGTGSFSTRSARVFGGLGDEDWGLGLSLDYQGSEGDFSFLDDMGTAWDKDDDLHHRRSNNHFDKLGAMAKGWLRLGAHSKLTLLNFLTWRHGGLAGLGLFDSEQSALSSLRHVTGLRLEITRPWDIPLEIAFTPHVALLETRLKDPLSEVGLLADGTYDTSVVTGFHGNIRYLIDLDENAEHQLIPMASLVYRFAQFTPRTQDGDDTATVVYPSTLRHLLSAGLQLSYEITPIHSQFEFAMRHEGTWSDQGTMHANGSDMNTAMVDKEAESFHGAFRTELIPQVSLLASVGRQLRFPNLYELWGNSGYVLGNPTLVPETALNVDMGLVHHAAYFGAGNYWTLEARAFVNWVDDLIQYVQNSQGVAKAENVQSARILGVELGTYLDLFQHLRLRASLTWLEAINTSEPAAQRGKRLPFRPEWKSHMRLEAYHVFESGEGDCGIHLEAESLAGNYLDHANLVRLPPRWLVGLGAHASFWAQQIRLDLALRNVTENQIQDFLGFPLPGFTAMASLRWSPNLEPTLGEEDAQGAMSETP